MENLKIRNAAASHNVKLWQIAAQLGINDGNFSRKLRHELPEAEQQKILNIITQLAAKKGSVEGG